MESEMCSYFWRIVVGLNAVTKASVQLLQFLWAIYSNANHDKTHYIIEKEISFMTINF